MGSGAKNFESFEILTAANLNNYLMSQSVISLPGTAAIGTAGTAIGTATTATLAPAEGMLVYLQDLNQYQMNLDGSASGWYPIAGQMPRCELTRSSTGTNFFTSGSTITITGWTQTELRGGFTESSGVVTVPLTGRYNVTGFFAFGTANTTGYRLFQIAQGGSMTKIWRNSVAPVSGAAPMCTLSINGVKLTAGDTLVLQGIQNSGSSLDLYYVAGFESKFIVEYVGP